MSDNLKTIEDQTNDLYEGSESSFRFDTEGLANYEVLRSANAVPCGNQDESGGESSIHETSAVIPSNRDYVDRSNIHSSRGIETIFEDGTSLKSDDGWVEGILDANLEVPNAGQTRHSDDSASADNDEIYVEARAIAYTEEQNYQLAACVPMNQGVGNTIIDHHPCIGSNGAMVEVDVNIPTVEALAVQRNATEMLACVDYEASNDTTQYDINEEGNYCVPSNICASCAHDTPQRRINETLNGDVTSDNLAPNETSGHSTQLHIYEMSNHDNVDNNMIQNDAPKKAVKNLHGHRVLGKRKHDGTGEREKPERGATNHNECKNMGLTKKTSANVENSHDVCTKKNGRNYQTGLIIVKSLKEDETEHTTCYWEGTNEGRPGIALVPRVVLKIQSQTNGNIAGNDWLLGLVTSNYEKYRLASKDKKKFFDDFIKYLNGVEGFEVWEQKKKENPQKKHRQKFIDDGKILKIDTKGNTKQTGEQGWVHLDKETEIRKLISSRFRNLNMKNLRTQAKEKRT